MDCISFANGRLFGCCRALPWAGLSRSSATFLYFEKKVILSYIPEAAFRTAAYGFIAVSAMLAVMPLTLLTADVPPRYPRRRAARRLPCKLLAACALALLGLTLAPCGRSPFLFNKKKQRIGFLPIPCHFRLFHFTLSCLNRCCRRTDCRMPRRFS